MNVQPLRADMVRTVPQAVANSFWTAERMDRLRQLWAAGWSYSKIAGELGSSRSSVAGKVYRLRLSRRATTNRFPQFDLNQGKPKKPPKPKKVKPPKPRRKSSDEPKLEKPFRKEINLTPERFDTFKSYDAESLRLPMADLPPNGCKFPVNKAKRREEHLFCGLPRQEGSPYCEHHHERAHSYVRFDGFVTIGDAASNVLTNLARRLFAPETVNE